MMNKNRVSEIKKGNITRKGTQKSQKKIKKTQKKIKKSNSK